MAVFESSSGPIINLDAVVYSQGINWGTEETPSEDNSGVIVFLADGSAYTFRGADATAFNDAYNPAP